MVQEKGATKRTLSDFLDEQAEDLEKRTIRYSWHVVERTPSYHVHSEYDNGDWIPAQDRKVSLDFDTAEEAQAWQDRHEPDEGKSLHIQRLRLIRREWTEWVSY